MTDAAVRADRNRTGSIDALRRWWGGRPLFQAALIALVVFAGWRLGANVVDGMAQAGLSPGFAFLDRAAGFEIGDSPIPYRAGDSYGRALTAGFLNTLKAAALGCASATALGVAVAVARMSGNPLLAATARGYIELVRNTPLLLQLFFWAALVRTLPPPRQAIDLGEIFFLTNRGLFVPALTMNGAGAPPFVVVPAAALAAVLAAVVCRGVFRYAAQRAGRRSGAGGAAVAVGAAVGVAVGAVAAAWLTVWALGASPGLEIPQRGAFNIRGGWSLTPEFVVLLAGLAVKFSAMIAEIIRAGFEAVPAGQWEAARALGLPESRTRRLVAAPQALRVIIPMLTSVYLDLTKDSSLAVAVGYPDLVNVANTAANTTGQAVEALSIVVAVYLTLNLLTSLCMNVYNRRVALRGDAPR